MAAALSGIHFNALNSVRWQHEGMYCIATAASLFGLQILGVQHALDLRKLAGLLGLPHAVRLFGSSHNAS